MARNSNRNVEPRNFRLERFSGFYGFQEALENENAGKMRSGANVELVDGEWWTRPGYMPKDTTTYWNLGSMPWMGLAFSSESGRGYLVNPFYALRVNLSTSSMGVRAAYTESATARSLTFTSGSDQATANTSDPIVGDLILL